MKKLVIITFLLAVISAGCQEAQAQSALISYRVRNGNVQVLRGNTTLLTMSTLDAKVDTVQQPLVGFVNTNLRFTGGGKTVNIKYGPANDSIPGRTAFQARNEINQAINGSKGNYLGAYKYSELRVSDTAVIGNYYYDTDTATFRFKRAIGGYQSLQPKQ
jgi:hypothetical protein